MREISVENSGDLTLYEVFDTHIRATVARATHPLARAAPDILWVLSTAK